MDIKLNREQKAAFERLWFIYGNGGAKHTLFNHKLIQGFYQYNEDRREVYRNGVPRLKKEGIAVTEECLMVCDLVMDGEIKKARLMALSPKK